MDNLSFRNLYRTVMSSGLSLLKYEVHEKPLFLQCLIAHTHTNKSITVAIIRTRDPLVIFSMNYSKLFSTQLFQLA